MDSTCYLVIGHPLLERMRNVLRRRSGCAFAALVTSARQFLVLINSAKIASIIGARNAHGIHRRRTGTHHWGFLKTKERARASLVLSSSHCHLALQGKICRAVFPYRQCSRHHVADGVTGLILLPFRMQKTRPLRHGGSCVLFEHMLGGNAIGAACPSRTQRKYVANAVTSGVKTVAESLLRIRMKN